MMRKPPRPPTLSPEEGRRRGNDRSRPTGHALLPIRVEATPRSRPVSRHERARVTLRDTADDRGPRIRSLAARVLLGFVGLIFEGVGVWLLLVQRDKPHAMACLLIGTAILLAVAIWTWRWMARQFNRESTT